MAKFQRRVEQVESCRWTKRTAKEYSGTFGIRDKVEIDSPKCGRIKENLIDNKCGKVQRESFDKSVHF